MNTQNKRERLIDSAAHLFHVKGMNTTSLADIAKHADIPIGNVYYYFKTKDELAVAALNKRREQFLAAYQLLGEAIDDPRVRMVEAIRYFDKARDEYTRHGSPVGKIIDDIDVGSNPVAEAAADIFRDFIDWAQRQFEALGHTEAARSLAITVVSGIQGAIVVAKALASPDVITAEVDRLTLWVESIPNRRIQLGKVAGKFGMQASEQPPA